MEPWGRRERLAGGTPEAAADYNKGREWRTGRRSEWRTGDGG
jgi:hypothetical protein